MVSQQQVEHIPDLRILNSRLFWSQFSCKKIRPWSYRAHSSCCNCWDYDPCNYTRYGQYTNSSLYHYICDAGYYASKWLPAGVQPRD